MCPKLIPAERTPRLRMKPDTPHKGCVDGAWWPRTDDLTAELPDLIAVLSERSEPVDRVKYNVGDWATAPATLDVDGHAVHLDGNRRRPLSTVDIVCAGHRTRIVLLVVAPNTQPDRAHATMVAAAADGDVATVDDLLVISLRDRESRTRRAEAQERWGS